jgi:hypothetical protein
LAILSRYDPQPWGDVVTEPKREEPMNAAVQKVPPSFKVVKWGVPPDKLDQLAGLLGLNDAQKAALKSGGDVVVAQDPQKS